jgi:iron(III) transport system substrate-binding protein
MKKIKQVLALLLVVMMIFTLAGCKAKTEAAQSTKSSAKEALWSSKYYDAKKMKGTTLNLYGVTDAIVPVLKAFTEDTGIKVENLTLKNGEILQRIQNEKDSGTVVADIWFTGGADAFINASSKGLLTPYVSSESKYIPDNMKDKDGYWYGTSLTVVDWVVNTKLIKEKGLKMPEKWDDLLQAGLKGQVSMPDPASSGTAYNTISAILQTKGEKAGWEYLDKLIAQVPFFTARGSDPANNVISGEAIVGINAGTGDKKLEENNPQVKIIYPSDGTGWWPQPVAIVAGCKHPDAAKVFIDWVLSKRGLEEVGKAQSALLVRDDVKAPSGILSLKDIKLFQTDFKANAAQRDTILKEWASKVK